MVNIPAPHYIVTHSGVAHRDEFYSCCLLLSLYPKTPIFRREPTEEELQDPNIWVLDIGNRLEPHLHNFDHHQLDDTVCTFTLLLSTMELREIGRQTWRWLDTTELADAKGPYEMARSLGTTWEFLRKASSPLENCVLEDFSSRSQIRMGNFPDWLTALMLEFGNSLHQQLESFSPKLKYVEENAQVTDYLGVGILILPKTKETLRCRQGIEAWVSKNAPHVGVAILPDERSFHQTCLLRLMDNQQVNFMKISEEPEIHFVHKGGFLAKIKNTSHQRTLDLCQKSIELAA